MSGDNVSVMPNWKKDPTPEEFLSEFAMLARVKPEQFSKMVVIWEEEGESTSITRFRGFRCRVLELIGLIESGKAQAFAHHTRDA